MSERVRRTRRHDSFDEPLPEKSVGVPQFRLDVVEGHEPLRFVSRGDVTSIGAHERNDVVLHSDTVSRFHAEIRCDAQGVWLVDVGSRNGTLLDGVRVREALLRAGASVRLGEVVLRYDVSDSIGGVPLSARTELGGMVGRSTAMRRVFALLERAAESDATVLLLGETGTGKTAAARALHDLSARKQASFGVVDCGSIAPSLLESELFGHERGAFTGADREHVGAFEAAEGGTVFLDEVGELPLELQPKLLRFLDERTLRRVGSTTRRKVDVRVVAATNRPLRSLVNEGLFRPDLYYRLAVVEVSIPPLRKRIDDLPLLVERLADDLAIEGTARDRIESASFLREISLRSFPGNVRELRNHLERRAVLGFDPELAAGDIAATDDAKAGSYADARRTALDRFEREFVAKILDEHAGNVADAAEAAGLDRTYFYRLIRRHRTRTE